MYLKPARLKAGDRVGVFLPASAVRREFRSAGLAALRRLGLAAHEVDGVLSRHGLFSRSSEQSLADFRQFLADDSIAALWAGRGGYGSNYLLPQLAEWKPPPVKMVIGSSDISYLLWFLLDRWHWVVMHGPMVYASLAEGKFRSQSLRRVLFGKAAGMRIPGRVLLPGQARAKLTGGCLTNFVSLLGTEFQPRTRGRILLLEDINEKPYRLDRLFWQTVQSGALQGIRALLLGEFSGCFRHWREKAEFLKRLRLLVAPWGIPVLYDMPLGHSRKCYTVPLGVEVEIATAEYAGMLVCASGVR